jgi:hypothetical protein
VSVPRKQVGYVYEANDVWHLRFYTHSDGVRKQRSRKLCAKSVEYPSKESVRPLADAFIATINAANAVNDLQPSHSCPVCGSRCKIRTKQRTRHSQTKSAGVNFAS